MKLFLLFLLLSFWIGTFYREAREKQHIHFMIGFVVSLTVLYFFMSDFI